MKKVLLCLLTFAVFGAFAETHLGGDLNKTTLEADGNPFIVEQDVSIPSGQHVMVKAGCIFLFKPFTGFQVHGRMTVEGSVDKPVVFTSINDEEFNPKSTQLANPFDWNGILITPESQSVAFKNFTLRFSVYGIKSQTPNITIQNGKFKQNGQFHFTINDKIQYVQDELFYSYGVDNQQSPDNTKTEKPRPVKKPKGGGKESTGKLVFRWGSLGIGVGGLVAGPAFLIAAAQSNKDASKLSDQMDALRINPSPDQAAYARLKSDLDAANSKTSARQIAGGILTGLVVLGLVGFGVSFAF